LLLGGHGQFSHLIPTQPPIKRFLPTESPFGHRL
jgi:hypothetical protein